MTYGACAALSVRVLRKVRLYAKGYLAERQLSEQERSLTGFRSIGAKSLAGIQELDFFVHEFPSLYGFGEADAECLLDVE